MISAIVPAAGLSSRMGQNKLLMRFGNKSLIEHAVDTLNASKVTEIVFVLGHEADEVRNQLEGKQLRFVQNRDYREGLSTSIRVGDGGCSQGSGCDHDLSSRSTPARIGRNQKANSSFCRCKGRRQKHCSAILWQSEREPGDTRCILSRNGFRHCRRCGLQAHHQKVSGTGVCDPDGDRPCRPGYRYPGRFPRYP